MARGSALNSVANADVPAITHEDGTARIQAVHRPDNPRYYDLIKAFGEETGVPVILNTSFNLRVKKAEVMDLTRVWV